MDRRMSKLNFNKKENKSSVEIVLYVRDKNGNPTDKTKTFEGSTRDAGSWYERQSPKKKKRKRKKKESKK